MHVSRAAVIVFLFGCGSAQKPASGNEERFTGKITEIDFGCAADASCDLVVDGKRHVHFGHDTRGEEVPADWGQAGDLWPLMPTPNGGVGRRVEVFAATLDHVNFTIVGKTTYYIKLLP